TFTQLMDEIAGTENRIATERMRYNDSVKDYNVAVRTFPGNLFAAQFNFKEAPMYPVPETEKATPKVDFGGLKPGTTSRYRPAAAAARPRSRRARPLRARLRQPCYGPRRSRSRERSPPPARSPRGTPPGAPDGPARRASSPPSASSRTRSVPRAGAPGSGA